jgi:hypothetical protein
MGGTPDGHRSTGAARPRILAKPPTGQVPVRHPSRPVRLLLALPAALLLSSCADQPLGPDTAPSFNLICVDPSDPGTCTGGGDGGDPPPSQPDDTTPPQTTIDTHPPAQTTNASAAFTFSGTDNVTAPASLAFECRLDGAGWAACTSPASYTNLALGSHTFDVRAKDAAGNIDPTPASHSWTIVDAGNPPAGCPPGTYWSFPFCVQASPGYYVAVYGATSQTPCAPGTFQPASGQTSCIPAPAGSFVAATAATFFNLCNPGFYQPATGQTACLLAPAGTFVAGPGAQVPTPCGLGTFQPNQGATFCIPAPAGTYVSVTGAVAATPCAAGTYQPGSGQPSCIPAPPGRFVPGIGAQASMACPVGTYQPASGQSSCLNAPAGSYVDVAGAVAATPCAVGTYQPLTRQIACINAPAGSYVDVVGAAAATPCALGSYQPDPGQTSCLPAPVGSYVDVTGAAAPIPCPAGTTTAGTGSTSVAACVAPPPSFQFGGFLSPVRADALNVVQAGRAVPINFSLGGDFGLAIFTAGSPSSAVVACEGGSPQEAVEATLTAGSSSLSYDAATQVYTYVWKTDRNWGNSCRRLTLELTDGTNHSVDFRFTR